MAKKEKEMFEATKTHSGQYKRYGDSYYEWDIITDLPEERVLEKMFYDVCKIEKDPPPHYDEWSKNIKVGQSREFDYGYYFSGYYKIDKTDFGYHFTICHPYTD